MASTSSRPTADSSSTKFRLFALVIGINVQEPPLNEKPLRGAVSDARSFMQWLTWRGVPLENIVLLTDEDATSAAIIDALTKLKTDNRIRRGDPIVIYFAGHGTEIKAPDGWECGRADRVIQGIVPHDCDAVKSGVKIGPIADRVLGALIGSIAKEKDNNIVVILDCCHSASGTRGAYHSDVDSEDTPRSVDLLEDYSESLERQLSNIGLDKLASASDINFAHSSMESHVLLAACRQSQKSYEGSTGGRFTAALLQVLYKEPLDRLRYSDIVSLMKPMTKQSPHCEGLRANRILFTSKIPIDSREAIPVEYKKGTHGRRGQYILHAGRIQQIKPQCQFALFDQFDFTRQLGTLTVTRSRHIDKFSSLATVTPIGHNRLNSDLKIVAIRMKYGKDDGFKENELKVFIPLLDKSPLRNLNLNGVSSVDRMDHANVGIFRARNKISFKIHTMSSDQRLAHPPWKKEFPADHFETKDVERILTKATHFFRELNFNFFDRVISKNVAMKFCEVLVYEDKPPKPVEPNLFKHGIVSIPYKPGAHYGIELDNKTELNLYVNVLVFDVSDLTIQSAYAIWPDILYKHDYSLLAGQKFVFGWGPTGRTFLLDLELPNDQSRGVLYLKIYISTEPINMTYMSQESPFDAPSRRAEMPTQPSPTVSRWAVIPMPIVLYHSNDSLTEQDSTPRETPNRLATRLVTVSSKN